MISTKNLTAMPPVSKLHQLCKSLSALELIVSPEWQYRYYSYAPHWAEGEEVMEMRDGSGDEMLVLFNQAGCVINGIAHEYFNLQDRIPRIEDLTHGLPEAFEQFMFGEPVKSIYSTFCIWSADGETWQTGITTGEEDGSAEILDIFAGDPQQYVDFCADYYEQEVPLEVVTQVYAGEPITAEMLNSLNPEASVREAKAELDDIGYPNQLVVKRRRLFGLIG